MWLQQCSLRAGRVARRTKLCHRYTSQPTRGHALLPRRRRIPGGQPKLPGERSLISATPRCGLEPSSKFACFNPMCSAFGKPISRLRDRIEITSRKPLDTNPKRQRGDSLPIADTPRSRSHASGWCGHTGKLFRSHTLSIKKQPTISLVSSISEMLGTHRFDAKPSSPDPYS